MITKIFSKLQIRTFRITYSVHLPGAIVHVKDVAATSATQPATHKGAPDMSTRQTFTLLLTAPIALLLTPLEASVQILIKRWRRHHNTVRPHIALEYCPTAPESIVPIGQRPTKHQHSDRTTRRGQTQLPHDEDIHDLAPLRSFRAALH